MSDLVLLHHNEPMTTSLAIADGTENTHQAIMKMVRTYVAQLHEFGEVGFQIRLNPQGSPTEFAFLNEPQATLLITFLRNSEVVVCFKVALVKAFYAMRDRLQAPAPTLTTNLSHGADIAVAADRTFRSFMRAARSAGMALPAALKIANIKTVERTGIDMLAELDVDPDAVQVRPTAAVEPLPDPFVDALMQWAATVPPGSSYRMADILRMVSGIEPTSKAFQRQSPAAGRLLRRMGWGHRYTRAGGLTPHRYWTKD